MQLFYLYTCVASSSRFPNVLKLWPCAEGSDREVVNDPLLVRDVAVRSQLKQAINKDLIQNPMTNPMARCGSPDLPSGLARVSRVGGSVSQGVLVTHSHVSGRG